MRQDTLLLLQTHMEKTVGYEWGSMGERTAICYPDGRRAAYEYNEAMQLSALKLLSDDAQEKTILYSYDEAGRLTGKQFPGGNRTDYSYNGAGKIKEIFTYRSRLYRTLSL